MAAAGGGANFRAGLGSARISDSDNEFVVRCLPGALSVAFWVNAFTSPLLELVVSFTANP